MEQREYQEPYAPSPQTVVEPANIKWGAIFGGTVAALGVGAMLYALGLALGLSSINPQDPSSLRPSGIFTGIWALVVSLIALFVGGFVASRGAGAVTRGFGALHGLVVWGLTVVGGVWLLSNIASTLLSGAASVASTATQAVVSAAPQAGDLSGLAQRFGITSDDVLAPVNERLRAQGSPEVTAEQLEAATRDAVQQGVRQGQLDRNTLIEAITANTALTRADANEVAARMETRFRGAQGDLKQTWSDAQTSALGAVESSGTAFWGLFGALFLGLIASVGGAVVGGHRGRGRSRSRPVVVERDEPPHPSQRAAYP